MLPRVRVAALLAPLAVAAALIVAPSPAQADGGTASAPDVVLYDSCQTYPITYSSTIPAGASFWQLQLQVFTPDQTTSEGYVVNSGSNAYGMNGTFPITFCGSETPGAWTVQTSGFYQLLLPARLPLATTTTTFTVRRAHTSTALSSKALRNGRWQVKARVSEEGPQGFAPSDGANVQLQRLVGGQWVAVPRKLLTVSAGRATVRLHVPPRTKLRGVTTQAGNHDGSVSAPITLKRR